MSDPTTATPGFRAINRGYGSVFRPDKLSIGLVVPIENYAASPVPSMARHVERVRLAERLGFSAVWIRDVPYDVPSFGDAGQTYDPFVYLGLLAAHTERIALGVASVVLPLRHPAHVAKAAATVDQLSGGRLILGIASGDRPEEYPALGLPYADRGRRFRESLEYIRQAGEPRPFIDNEYGRTDGRIDLLPKPVGDRLPLLITGGSQQTPEWLARNGDGWMIYPRSTAAQAQVIADWRADLLAAGEPDKPILQPLYLDLDEDPDSAPVPIHLGYRMGSRFLRDHLEGLQRVGVNHVALNLRFNRLDIEETLEHLAADVLPPFAN